MGYRPAMLRNELRYLRREGNRRVRMQRRRKTALRAAVIALLAVAAIAVAAFSAGLAGKWLAAERRLPLARIQVRGNVEARANEIEESLSEWRGRNILTLPLDRIEKRVREHPWVGAAGAVAIRRKLPGTLVVELKERTPAGMALSRHNAHANGATTNGPTTGCNQAANVALAAYARPAALLPSQ